MNNRIVTGNITQVQKISGNIQKAQTIYKDNYNDLKNKPTINGVILKGNKTLEELGITAENILNLSEVAKTGNYEDLNNKPEIPVVDINKDYVDSALSGKVDKSDGKGLSSNDFTNEEKNKLSNLQNYDDTTIKTDISALQTDKVDKISGKVLSSNDYTTTEKTKLASLENYDDTALKSSIAMNLSSIGLRRKNLLKPALTTERAGVTYTVREDGSVILTGSNISTSYNYFSIPVTLQAGRYKVSGMPENSSLNTYRVDLRANESGGTAYGYGISEFEVEFTETTSAYYMIRIDASYKENLDNITFYPMIRYADITDNTYETYKDDLQTQINNLYDIIKSLSL